MLIPKRWYVYGISITIGSTIGALTLSALVQYHGLPWFLEFFPGVDKTDIWMLTEKFFNEHGLLVVLIIGATPLMQQPAIILSALAGNSLVELIPAFFIGRFLKFMLMAYLGSHSPKLLKKIWGMKDELDEAGVKIE